MRIGIDLYSFIPMKNFGVGPTNYAYTLTRHLVDTHKEHTFVLFTNKDNEDFFPESANCRVVRSRMPPSKGVWRVIHEQFVLPIYFYKYKLDVIHFTGNVISFLLYQRSVFTVHDLMWKYYQKSNWVPLYKKIYYSMLCPLSFRLAKAIITMSTHIKSELLSLYHLDEAKISVIPPGRYVQDLPLTPQETAMFKQKYGENYLLTITTTWPHKNLITLLKAYVILREKYKDSRCRLIVAGQNRLKSKEIEQFITQAKLGPQEVLFLGFVPEKTIKYLYSHAGVLIFPSLYEGFGVPPLEAMKFGVPTVVSHVASLPEVGGDACLYADPRSPEDFAEKIHRLLIDPELRYEMVRRGKTQEAKFSWPDSAAKTMALYEKTVRQIPGRVVGPGPAPEDLTSA